MLGGREGEPILAPAIHARLSSPNVPIFLPANGRGALDSIRMGVKFGDESIGGFATPTDAVAIAFHA